MTFTLNFFKPFIIGAAVLVLAACGKDTPSTPSAGTKTTQPVTYTADMFKTDGLTLVEGKDYKRVPNPQPVTSGKVEVTEFFWYGCPHCYRLEPALQAWSKTLPADIQVTRVHVNLGEPSNIHQKVYFALKTLKQNEALDQKVFDALAFNVKSINDDEAAKAFAVKNGIDAAAWDKAYNSFDTKTAIATADGLAKTYGLEGVPTIIVNGKYAVGGDTVRTLQVVNKLIEQERAASGAQPAAVAPASKP
jgi:thiol:disulfide interchange protein DsbA